jgi:RNA-directed DNA polymerase
MSQANSIRLGFFDLPIVESLEDFSRLTHLSKYTIFQLSKHSGKYYKTYQIPKKNGKYRDICQPSKNLKGLQAWILVNILDKLNVSSSSKGFKKGASIIDNVEPHKTANSILVIDIKDFFPSISRAQVYNVFRVVGYNKYISALLTNLCTYNNCLPQGSPCSPFLANLICSKLDTRIQGYVGKRGITYTRYADDLTFSSLNPSKLIKIFSTIQAIIESESFKVNPDKTRIGGSARAKRITGLTIFNDTYGIGNRKSKEIRAKIHNLIKDSEQNNLLLLKEVQGWLSYLKNVDPRRLYHFKSYIQKLCAKHPNAIINKLSIPNLS